MKTIGLRTFPRSPIYNKALDIFTLSRTIASYLVDDITIRDPHDHEDPSLYVTGDMVQQSISLAPEILKAEQQTFQEDKHKYIASVDRLANLLYRNCERLEKTHSNGKDFLPILRKELKKFRKLQHHWMLTL
ncbi:MAG: hypothetical protein ACI849_000099 [Patiriisocius sp.]|jgi:hypothetical protein